jgi:hypothetical protein
MHMKDSAATEKLVAAMPVVAPGRAAVVTTTVAEGTSDNPALLSQKATEYQRKLAAAGTTIDFAAAVRAVNEGKAA